MSSDNKVINVFCNMSVQRIMVKLHNSQTFAGLPSFVYSVMLCPGQRVLLPVVSIPLYVMEQQEKPNPAIAGTSIILKHFDCLIAGDFAMKVKQINSQPDLIWM